jgi:hypothetical protein
MVLHIITTSKQIYTQQKTREESTQLMPPNSLHRTLHSTVYMILGIHDFIPRGFDVVRVRPAIQGGVFD